jgi:hypothetical protein
MNPFETKGRGSRLAELARARTLDRNPKQPENLEATAIEHAQAMVAPYMPTQPLKSIPRALETTRLATPSPYVLELELPCDECGGAGFDPGGIDPWGPEPCPACLGAGTQRIIRNYLAEALRIAGNPECSVPVERAHLVAIVEYCRQAVSAVVSLPDVPERPRTEPVLKRPVRHRRSRTQSHEVTQIKRRKRNVDFSPQRT